ncbi:2,5-diamino-6-ribosylamino-43H-pyrimidinone 5'-phosphate reductase [Hondaea fermentalgiana]|uniref:2,5-diamino-6-ribosylamino-43H-pyrimidinone 5'-phosphate reductase n=1 Tax=Hondaea fermentalgiana TaxID=2315210 RepID=A0A2R5GCK4_9STRA|nr:2,5-diamino-6-ribosylamino-43H-pyrimidinone 5'-phosphate reductase [Hondaea fermentalgiana]|eukprot:GBG28710.1 2,5-diamino-6-ribosylamino-43H-pyrimidinone 5'-phosphate reductase [Hondaea fermentalgiana]
MAHRRRKGRALEKDNNEGKDDDDDNDDDDDEEEEDDSDEDDSDEDDSGEDDDSDSDSDSEDDSDSDDESEDDDDSLPDDPEEIERLAREQWKDRGFNEADFTVEKMFEIWAREEEEGLGRARASNNLQRKMELLRMNQEAEVFDTAALKAMAKAKALALKEQAKDFALETKERVLPPFVKRMLRLRAHERKAAALINTAQAAHDLRLEQRRIRHEEIAKEKLEQERQRERVERQEQFKAFRRKQKEEAILRDKKLASEAILKRREQERVEREAQEAEDAAKERQRIHERTRARRRRDIKSWLATHRTGVQEAAQRKEDRDKIQRAREKLVQERFEQETQAHNAQVEKDALGLPTISPGVPGIFAKPIGAKHGAPHGVHRHDRPAYDLFDPELDATTLEPPFSSADASKQVALLEIRVMEAESLVAAALAPCQDAQSKLDANRADIRSLDEQILTLDREIVHIDNEQKEFRASLRKPPRREPNRSEMERENLLTRRKFEIRTRIDSELRPRLEVCKQSKQDLETQFALAEERLHMLREEALARRAELDARLEMQPELPLVIGRALHKVDEHQGQPAVDPVRSFEGIVQRTNAELLRHAAAELEKHRKDLTKMAQQKSTSREEYAYLKSDLELSVSRLAETQTRIQRAQEAQLRANLVMAIETFFQKGGIANLAKISNVYAGALDWWQGHQPEATTNVRLVDEVAQEHHADEKTDDKAFIGVTADVHDRVGTIEGIIQLPRHRLYRVTTVIARHPEKDVPGRAAQLDVTDYINVRFGPSLQQLSLIGKVFNAPSAEQPPGAPVHHTITTLIAGTSVAYRFDFRGSSTQCALVVKNGWVQEEEANNPADGVDKDSPQVLTDFVRQLRIERLQGKDRANHLLEELIRAKECPKPYWDSSIFQGTLQRFEKNRFLQMLQDTLEALGKEREELEQRKIARRDALLKLHESQAQPGALVHTRGKGTEGTKPRRFSAARAQHQELLARKAHDSEHLETMRKEAELDEKMILAKERYINRKRRGMDGAAAIEEGQRLVGRKLEIFFADIARWRVGKVMDMKASWVDQNTRLQVLHKLELSDEPEGSSKWDDLLARRFVELKVDVSDVEERRKELEEDRLRQKRQDREERERVAAEEAREDKEIKERATMEKNELLRKAAQEVANAGERIRAEIAFAVETSEHVRGLVQVKTDELRKELLEATMAEIGSRSLGRRTREEIGKTAAKEAQKSFAEKPIAVAESDIKEKWQHEMKLLKARHALIVENFHAKLKARREQEAANLFRKRNAGLAARKRQRAELGKLLAIVDIEKALPPATRCEHRRVRYWGTQYKNGVRCLRCNAEVSRSFCDPSQAWEMNAETGAAIALHRRAEARYIAANPEQDALIEAERQRVEKEERLIEAAGRELPGSQLAINLEKLNARHLLPTSLRNSDVHAGHWGDPTPLRTRYARNQALRMDYMTHFSRVRGYKLKLADLARTREALLRERRESTAALEEAHQDNFAIENRTLRIEGEYHRAQELLRERREAIERTEKAEATLELALEDRIEKELIYDATCRDLFVAEAKLDIRSNEARHALVQSQQIDKDRDRAHDMLTRLKKELQTARENHKKAENILQTVRWQQRGSPVLYAPWAKRLGLATIVFCRPVDPEKADDQEDAVDMVKIRLVCGGSQIVFLYCPLQPIIDEERRREAAERPLMEAEDAASAKYARAEAAFRVENQRLMEREEILQRQVEEVIFRELVEERAVEEARGEAMLNALQVLQLKWKREQFKRLAREHVNREHLALVEALAEFDLEGPTKAQPYAPEPFSKAKRRRARRQRYMELCAIFQDEQADLAEAEIRLRYKTLREREERDAAIEAIIEEIVDGESRSIAEAYHVNSLDTAQRRMDESNVYLAGGQGVEGILQVADGTKNENDTALTRPIAPLGTAIHFEVYRDLSRLRRARRVELERLLAHWAHHNELEKERLAAQRAWEARAEEREREEAENDAMELEDIALRQFYLEERQAYLAERWAMAEEEQSMRAFLKEEAMRAMKSKYDVEGLEVEEKSKKQLRRDEIKKVVADRQRAKREQKQMLIEDDLSYQMRLEYNRQMQKLLMQHEMGLDAGDMEGSGADAAAQAMNAALARAHQREIEKQKRKLAEEERKYSRRVNQAFLHKIKYELQALKLEDEVAKWYTLEQRKRALALRAGVFMRKKVDADTKARRDVEQRRAETAQARERAEAAQRLVDETRPQIRQSQRDKIAVLRETEFINSDVVHENMNRFHTQDLYGELHYQFFYMLSCQIANNAEVVSLERTVRRTVEALQTIGAETRAKQEDLRALELQWRRRNWLRLRRAELGAIFFSITRRKALDKAFCGWHEYAVWQKRTREAFEVRVGVTKHGNDLQKVFRTPVPDEISTRDESSSEPETQTILRKHTNRKVKCQNCKQVYMESANHAQACAYHPGTYELACPQTCTVNRSGKAAESGSVDTRCAAHYRRRWSCCDKTKAVPFGFDGCQQRWHMPENIDPKYEGQVRDASAKKQRAEGSVTQVKRGLQELRRIAKRERLHDLDAIRDRLAHDRELGQAQGAAVAASHVTLTFAQSLDGSIARRRGEPVAISSPESFAFTHALRATHAAIVVGIGTMLADNPSLTTRHVDGEDPQPVIIDANLETPLSSKLFTDERCRKKPLLLAVAAPGTAQTKEIDSRAQREAALRAAGAEIEFCGAEAFGQDGRARIALQDALRVLRRRFDSVMIEGGAGVITGILSSSECVAQIDRVVLTIAPAFFGGYNYMQRLCPENTARAWKTERVETASGDILVSLVPRVPG